MAVVNKSSVFRRSAGALVLSLIVGLAGAARAAEHRYALMVGSDVGGPGEQPLRFAVADARRMAGVLTTLGGFASENTVVLESPSSDRVRQVLARLNASIRAESKAGDSSMLLVYFSGHADALALHLGASTLPWDELRNWVSGSAAHTRLLVIDACRSGHATRVKGTRLEQPFALPDQSQPPPEGVAILSSAAAGEVAQESDELGASFFTHHLVSALSGAGDSDGDGAVTLAEAYRYAADLTIVGTAATLSGVQHPTYLYELRGRSDVVVTRTDAMADLGSVRLPGPAVYLIREQGGLGPLLLAAEVPAGKARLVRLRPGKYLVQRRDAQQLLETDLDLPAQRTADLTQARYRAAAYRQQAVKGASETRRGYAIALEGGVGNAVVADFEPALRGALRLQRELRRAIVELELAGYTSSSRLPPAKSLSGMELLAGVTLGSIWRRFEASAGARLGAAWISEVYREDTANARRDALLPVAEVVARAGIRLGDGWFAFVGTALRLSYLRQQTSIEVAESRLPLQFLGAAGAGWRW